jgi:hypothetical protein
MVKSTQSKFLQPLLLLICFALVCCLCGCGNSGDTNTNTNTTSSPSITLSVPSNIVYGTPVTATATLLNASGAAIQGAVVTFTAADSGFVTFTPTSAKVLTNASGVASVTLNAASIDSAGATYITASTTTYIGGTATTVTSNQVGVSVSGGTVTLGALTVGTSPISAYGTSSLSIPVLINGVSATVPISLTFTSSCVNAGLATISSPVTSSAGTAISTYKDNGCASGSSDIVDTITASVTSRASATNTITVHPTQVSNIQFVSASPAIIGVKGTGSVALPQSSLVTFKVVDNKNNGKSGVNVAFSLLPTNVSGTGITFSPSSADSGSDGTVSTTVTSGTMPTPLWVVATTTVAPIVSSQSNTLAITTGLPTQKRFSLSVATFNIEGWDYDGVPDKVSVLAFDRLGNPVPDGTAISFYSEAAGFDSATCSTANGAGSVTFLSENSSRPTDGRITILASAVGEKSFDDNLIHNNSYDTGETFYDLGARYIDADESGTYTAGDILIDSYDPSTSLACTIQPSGNPLPSDYAKSATISCDGKWDINYVRNDNVIILSSSYPEETSYSVTMGGQCLQTFTLPLSDINGNAMPAGTKVSTGTSYIYYTPNGATATSTATATITGGSPVINTPLHGTFIALTVSADCSAGTPVIYPAGTTNVVVTSPKGLITNIPVTVN